MKELQEGEVRGRLFRQPIMQELQEVLPLNRRLYVRGVEEEEWVRYIAGIFSFSAGYWPVFERVLEDYFSRPVKDFDQLVVVGTTVPREYVPHLNSMHGVLSLGIVHTSGYISLEDIVRVGVSQQGGSRDPPVNLFNKQAFYGKHNREDVEIVRVCPFMSEEAATLEYMLSSRR